VSASISELAQEVREDWQREGLHVVTVEVIEIPAELRLASSGSAHQAYVVGAGLADGPSANLCAGVS